MFSVRVGFTPCFAAPSKKNLSTTNQSEGTSFRQHHSPYSPYNQKSPLVNFRQHLTSDKRNGCDRKCVNNTWNPSGIGVIRLSIVVSSHTGIACSAVMMFFISTSWAINISGRFHHATSGSISNHFVRSTVTRDLLEMLTL